MVKPYIPTFSYVKHPEAHIVLVLLSFLYCASGSARIANRFRITHNYKFILLSAQLAIHILSYQSIVESVPEMESVKELYDARLEFLYGLYDQYNADWNTEWEAAIIPAEEFEQ